MESEANQLNASQASITSDDLLINTSHDILHKKHYAGVNQYADLMDTNNPFFGTNAQNIINSTNADTINPVTGTNCQVQNKSNTNMQHSDQIVVHRQKCPQDT